MDDSRVKAKAARYREILAKTNAPPKACDPRQKGPDPMEMASHAIWMCDRVPRLCVEGKSVQAREWIRFVEGVLWSTGVLSFEDMTRDALAPGILRA